MKTRIFKTLGVILCTPLSFFAQQSLTGKVINQDGIALAGAKVSMQASFQVVYTNKEGVYEFTHVKEGEYLIDASFSGYETESKITTVESKNQTLNFQLTASAIYMEEVQVNATRANEKTPTTFTNLSKKEIEQANFGQDLPYLLESTPSTVVSSDAGAGVGYTGVRIRGVDPTRTNVTINGIPVNDGESHGVFWVNMPDFSSNAESIQIQRGVGTSSNGAAAFGASLNIKTDNIYRKPYAELDNSFGSFNTLKNTLKAGTGLINKKFTLDTRLSRISSNGYVDRAASNLKSFYISGAWIGNKSLIRANVFSGLQQTYQAWNGIPESRLKNDVAGMHAFADRNFYSQDERDNLLNSGRTYNYFTYKNQNDNYQQDHYQLHFTHQFSSKLTFNVSGHYTRGKGYYEEYKKDQTMSNYGLQAVILNTDTVASTDLIRRKWLDNHFYGMVFGLNYDNLKGLKLTWGGGINQYTGKHFGDILWARFASGSEIGDHYYDNSSQKLDANTYVKANYTINKWNLYGDLQVRNIQYSFLGIDYVGTEIKDVQQKINYTFFNPKLGFSVNINDKNLVYTSLAVANREPVRDDFRESTPDKRPTSEKLLNLESGYELKSNRFLVRANIYAMYYKNQLILTGQINDVGGYTRTNADQSYRAGIEAEFGYKILRNLSLTANATLSQNKIVAFNEFIDDYDLGGQRVIAHKNTDIAFSPNLITSIGLHYEPIKNLSISLLCKYVGKQYLDNTSSDIKQMNDYVISNLNISYSIKKVLFKEINIGLLVNNLFNYTIANNGYTYSYISNQQVVNENFYFPQAGINLLGRVTFKL